MFTQAKEPALLSVGSEARSRSDNMEEKTPLGPRPSNITPKIMHRDTGRNLLS